MISYERVHHAFHKTKSVTSLILNEPKINKKY